jgi:hypothetical protein
MNPTAILIFAAAFGLFMLGAMLILIRIYKNKERELIIFYNSREISFLRSLRFIKGCNRCESNHRIAKIFSASRGNNES